MAMELIFITGYFGARLEEQAQEMAQEKEYGFLSLDEEIERTDGRSVRRICMMMGEHEYRNKEYEVLQRIIKAASEKTEADEMKGSLTVPLSSKGLVICCGDGVLLDDQSRALLQNHKLLVLGGELAPDELWQNAIGETDTYHAFMHFGTEEERRTAFDDLHKRQQALFASL